MSVLWWQLFSYSMHVYWSASPVKVEEIVTVYLREIFALWQPYFSVFTKDWSIYDFQAQTYDKKNNICNDLL